jgi:hypothetical protein
VADVRVGQVWKKSDRELITVDGIDGNMVSGVLADSVARCGRSA